MTNAHGWPVAPSKIAQTLEHRTGEIKRELERLVDSIGQGMPADVIAPKARALEADTASIAEQLMTAKGRLQELIGAPFMRRCVGGTSGSGRGTRTPDPRIMIPVL
jgi:hypothetical protein